MIGPLSRYASVPVASYETPDGSRMTYLRRRFVPSGDEFVTIGQQRVEAGERLDQITARVLGDPEQFWRIADANDAIDPLELTKPGNTIRITMPQGIPGPRDAR